MDLAEGSTPWNWSQYEQLPTNMQWRFMQHPVLIPNSMILGGEVPVLEENPEDEDENDWKKRQRCIKICKDTAGRRWQRAYLTVWYEA